MITCHIENFEQHLPELKALLPGHYRELALNQDQVPLDPQYAVYIERERQGGLLFVTLRDAGELVGYYIGFIAPGLHYRTCLTCTTDIFYLRPDKRKGGAGLRMFQFVESELRRRGVQRWFMGSKVHMDASYLFKLIDAEPVETYYSKWLGG
ncbi:GNAT family N-acetyltransferase [Janthinobacterium sp. UMAB-56]|uniref:GNAT family N-acetyltransferase n=1 Tax=Janthinobacterium sp. UMAB-56 TaxID=1365361 RepID=UPI001C55DBCB|nr:GNAT family N-acetyltransferase [Janthinobacterium sp. UMAB-56]